MNATVMTTSETAYSPEDLQSGVCECCREMSSQIVKGEGMCVDCLEEIKFIEACYAQENKSSIIKQQNHENKNLCI
jgi:hypothetical protein